MKEIKLYEQEDRMASIIRDNHNVLHSLGAFGISMGFGDKTVHEVCVAHGVDTFSFLAVVNFTVNGYHSQHDIHHLDVHTLLCYLRASHRYYIEFQFPFLRKQLLEALDEGERLSELILSLFDDFANFVNQHMRYEEKTLFPYVEMLLHGRLDADGDIVTFSKHHDQTGNKLRELKSIIIKYLPSDPLRNHLLTTALYGLYNLEEWLTLHAKVEEYLFVPAIQELETNLRKQQAQPEIPFMALARQPQEASEALSERERDVVVAVVEGLTNKEIADKLFIAPNTVITHRRNIARKLQIHSVAGLTIYAIANGLVKL